MKQTENKGLLVLAWVTPVIASVLLPLFVYKWPHKDANPLIVGSPWLLIIILCGIATRRSSSTAKKRVAKELFQGSCIALAVTMLFYFVPSVALTMCGRIYWDYHVPFANTWINNWANYGACD